MDLSSINLLFSAVFILIGSLAFHISALVSGEDIYRDLPTQESALLSIVSGIVIFLLSPISFIILSNSNACYVDTVVQILDFEVLLAFFGCAFGLGLIFGALTISKARVTILNWFRDESGMRFWIFSYGIAWDDFLSGVKREGELFVQTDGKVFKGSLVAFSAKHEQREIVLGKYQTIGTDGSEVDLEDITKDEKNADVLIPGSEIKRIIVPGRSFKKHYESMGHISQAFYRQISAIGFFFLSFSAKLTGNHIEKAQNLTSASLEFFYDWLSQSFLVLTIIVLCVSVWVAKKDFDNWRSFLVLSPFILFVAFLFSLLSILLISDCISITQAVILIFALFFIYPFYIKIVDWLGDLKKYTGVFNDWIKQVFNDWISFLGLFYRYRIVAISILLIGIGILLAILITQISQVFAFMYAFISLLSISFISLSTQISPLLAFIFVFSLLCIAVGNQLKKPIKKCFCEIKGVFEDTELLEEVIQKFYLRLSCNDKEKKHIENIQIQLEILAECKNCHEMKKIMGMVKKLDDLKDDVDCLKNEDFNIILEFRKYLKKKVK